MSKETFKLPFGKASVPATWKQIKYLESLIVSCNVSTSQLQKRISFSDASNLIDLAKNVDLTIEG